MAAQDPSPTADPGRRPMLGAALLLVAAVVWGFAFVPQKLTVEGLPPFTATALRFLLAAPVAFLVAGRRIFKPGIRVRQALQLGVVLFIIYTLQTAGLVYAPVARVSLITGMYAVFVPLFAPFLGHARPGPRHWAGALLAFLGLLALTGVLGDRDLLSVPLNKGDVFVLLHALISAFQVLLVGKLAKTADAFALNALQLLAVLALALPAALIVDGIPHLSAIAPRTWAAFGYLAGVSTVIAFVCQIIGQRHTSPSTAAVIMLLETPVGVLAAVVLLGEGMGVTQWIGAAVLVSGVAVSLSGELRRQAALTGDARDVSA